MKNCILEHISCTIYLYEIVLELNAANMISCWAWFVPALQKIIQNGAWPLLACLSFILVLLLCSVAECFDLGVLGPWSALLALLFPSALVAECTCIYQIHQCLNWSDRLENQQYNCGTNLHMVSGLWIFDQWQNLATSSTAHGEPYSQIFLLFHVHSPSWRHEAQVQMRTHSSWRRHGYRPLLSTEYRTRAWCWTSRRRPVARAPPSPNLPATRRRRHSPPPCHCRCCGRAAWPAPVASVICGSPYRILHLTWVTWVSMLVHCCLTCTPWHLQLRRQRRGRCRQLTSRWMAGMLLLPVLERRRRRRAAAGAEREEVMSRLLSCESPTSTTQHTAMYHELMSIMRWREKTLWNWRKEGKDTRVKCNSLWYLGKAALAPGTQDTGDLSTLLPSRAACRCSRKMAPGSCRWAVHWWNVANSVVHSDLIIVG